MQPDDLDFANLDELITAFAAADVTAVTDVKDIRPPCVWVRFDALPPSPLAACVMRLTLFPVVLEGTDRRRTLGDLAALWNEVRPVVEQMGGPSGDVTPTGLVLATGGTAQPALSVPLDLVTVASDD